MSQPSHVDLQDSRSLPCVFSWEFFTTLDYEWSIIQGRRPYRWTIWVRSTASLFFPPTDLHSDIHRLQIYSLTRVAALLSVIVNIIGFDASKPINCQVSSRPPSTGFSLPLTGHDLKAWVMSELVSNSNISRGACSVLNACFRPSLTSPLLLLCCWSRSARKSSMRYHRFFQSKALIGTTRIILWNRNRIIFMIASSVFWTNFSFLVQGKSVLQITGNCNPL